MAGAPVSYFILSLVILVATVSSCIPGCRHLIRKICLTANINGTVPGHIEDDAKLITTNPVLFFTAVFSVLLAIGLLIYSGLALQRPNTSDHKLYQISLLVFHVLISKSAFIYESIFLYFLGKPHTYRWQLWIFWIYSATTPLWLSLLLWKAEQGVVVKVSHALSAAEYFLAAIRHCVLFCTIATGGWRVRTIFYINIFACSAMSITSVIFLVLVSVAKVNLVFSQWLCTTLISICILRFPVFNAVLVETSSSYALGDSPAISKTELIKQPQETGETWTRKDDTGYHTVAYGGEAATSQVLYDLTRVE